MAPSVNWDARLTTFEKLMLLKCLKEEKLVFAIAEYVATNLGAVFIESPTVQLNTLYVCNADFSYLIIGIYEHFSF